MNKEPVARFTIVLPESIKAQLQTDVEQADAELQKLHHDRIQMEASKATIVQGLQNELALTQNNIKKILRSNLSGIKGRYRT